jgi:hypothetical protein
VRLPDGEFALDRQTPSNARFHPVRAFKALGIEDHEKILDIYLGGFAGRRTPLWQPQGGSDVAAALAAQVYEFYAGSQRHLDELHAALAAFGGLSDFYRRFCEVPGLPTFLDDRQVPVSGGGELMPYFATFYRRGLKNLERLTAAQVATVRWRRMLQMRAYYSLQVRWLLSEGLVVARSLTAPKRHRLVGQVDEYLNGLSALLSQLAIQPHASPEKDLGRLDENYDSLVRTQLSAHDVWVGQRWLIAPRRAGGRVGVFETPPAKAREAKIRLLQTVAFLVDELTPRMRDSKTVEARAAVLAQIQRVATLGAAGGQGTMAKTRAALKQLQKELARPETLALWSVPLAAFDPVANQYRELAFSYQ